MIHARHHLRQKSGVLLPLILAALLPGCVRPIPADEASVAAGAGRAAASPGEIDVRVFKGGYGTDFYEDAAAEYVSTRPGISIDLQGDPRIWDQLRPRFVAGEPPSLAFPGWGMDHYALIYEHQVRPMDDVLLTTPFGETTGAWGDTFLPDILKMGMYEGKTYLLPYYVNLNGWWYNTGLFAEKGWRPPRTYQELLELGDRIKGEGIAPITYQGKYPAYTLQGFIFPWVISVGGIEAYLAAEGLEPGAWKSDAFLDAARRVVELRDRGFFQKGADGMSHTEAQMEFLNGKAAMIPCGTWLESEMKKQMPDGFRMAFFLPPVVEGGKGDPTALQVGVEPWLFPSRGQNSYVAIDFFKFLTSKRKAREFVLKKGTLTAVKGTSDGELPPNLQAPARALREAGVTWTTRYAKWYPSLDEALKKAMSQLLQDGTPEQFVAEAEAAAEKVRKDRTIPKHKAR